MFIVYVHFDIYGQMVGCQSDISGSEFVKDSGPYDPVVASSSQKTVGQGRTEQGYQGRFVPNVRADHEYDASDKSYPGFQKARRRV